MILSRKLFESLIEAGDASAVIQPIVREVVEKIDVSTLARHFLDKEDVEKILAEKMEDNPAETYEKIEEITTEDEKPAVNAQKQKRKKTPQIRANRLDELKEETLNLINGSQGIAKKELMAAINYTSSSAFNRVIKELNNEGEIYAEGDGRGVKYYIS
jgi:hypothetical protein